MKAYDLDQPMDRLIDLAVRKFGPVEFQKVSLGGLSLEVLQVTDMQQYIETLVNRTRAGKTVSLPLWAKVWPSCLVLGYMLSRYPFPEGCRILEIGAGGAVNGMVLASRGLAVTISDIDPDALLFSRINVLKNGLEEFATITRMDFTRSDDETRFDCIVGCEVLYDEAAYEPLIGFLDRHLAVDASAEVFLALDEKRQTRKFFTQVAEHFSMARTCSKYNEKVTGEERTVNLFRLKRKTA
ncbi:MULTISPECIES: class I SAM-dependent methyltransferase [Pseudodesulfovibrio]|uniref:Methyltransferase-16, putative n=1 Tax=Pseudodesulfovibrio aespoeensis (strain ATCC 700646 / DSM 10631 / Aspo-2) TaxID=643562 RepID=E6VVB9_PSEA9|nr:MULTISPECIES: methyltransferase [Pseudodesulfovibrio]ADU62363.1 Methyltransferase-16, putative [Pseudodesulfovibrio aespoeensis Aspo-2]MCG2734074.1 protein N-lysine methyltransferase family protein [Pseudodesulfovibrio aespoeensis]